MSPLHVYKASAGSGKTFALTLEYLKLLFMFPDAHRSILAVTFTNKAAGEMKERILTRLSRLSVCSPGDGNEDLDLIRKATGLGAQEVIKRSGMLLHRILNDYSGFSVGTIDRFFQSVIRAFTREIGIQPAYNLELDYLRILSMGVDRLLQELGEHPGLQRWLVRYAEERIEDERSWNFRSEIISLGEQLFREAFQELYGDADLQLLSKQNLEHFQEELGEAGERAGEDIRKAGAEALGHLEHHGLTADDFKLRSKSPAVLFRQAADEGEVDFSDSRIDALSQVEKWLNRDAPGWMTELTQGVLMPLLNRIYQGQVILNTARAIRRNFYTLGILNDIRDRIRSHLQEHNLFLISDSSRFLRGIIGGNQVPFIYEKTGNRYLHIMLDEFQDTSRFQYDNFRPLLEHSLASGHENLAVGDVKQSIYRWRNSDWQILATGLEKDFSHQEFHVHTLDHNYRSLEQLIRFNNTVFQLVPGIVAGLIRGELMHAASGSDEAGEAARSFDGVFADAVQQVPREKTGSGGHVRIELFGEDADLSFRDRVLERIPAWIDEISASGIEPGETAILVRTRKEGVLVAERLLQHARLSGHAHRYRLVSSESLLLSHNDSVSLIISALHFLVYPADEINNALLKYRCFRSGFTGERGIGELFDTSLSPLECLPADFSERVPDFGQMPLYELVEALISLLGLNRREEDLPYVQALQDMIIELQRKENLGIADFLQYWEEHGSGKGIQVSESSNAIRILTIHRAKGLEFKAVLIPFCNWEITTDQRKPNIIWCATERTPFNRIPMVPLRFSSSMKHTLFAQDYYRERMKGYLDSLNLMYVAFTRAAEVLFLGIPDPEEGRLRTVGDLIPSVLDMEAGKGPALGPLSCYRKGSVISVGEMPRCDKVPGKDTSWKLPPYHANEGKGTLRLRLASDQMLAGDEGISRTGRGFGNMMHQVFSRIITADDLVPVLDRMEREGLVFPGERSLLQDQIRDLISAPEIRDWFSGGEGRNILNERSILCGDGEVARPDRVIVDGGSATVVDFKFGRVERDSYEEQVRYYMELLAAMDYDPVRGFIWYAMLGKTKQIHRS
jgi:ATP-dependent helicase/nuclease subunit A